MSSLDFDHLMVQYRKEMESHPHLISAMVELTYGCNLRCVHCYNPTHEAKNELSTEQILRILDDLACQGCLWVGFTGGELFTRRDAMQILKYAKRLGLVVSVLTNATLMTPRLADELSELEPFQMDISVYGATRETYEAVTRIPGSFEKFVRGVDLLVERKVPMVLKLVLMSLNLHEFEAMRQFAVERKIRYNVGTDIRARVDGSKEPLKYRITAREAFEIWRQTSGEGLRENVRSGTVLPPGEAYCSSGKLFECGCGKTNAAVTPYGKMNLCLSIYYPQYDLLQGNVQEGWGQLVNTVKSAKAGPAYQCQECTLASSCNRGTHDSWLEQGVFDSGCISYHREVAEQRQAFLNDEKV